MSQLRKRGVGHDDARGRISVNRTLTTAAGLLATVFAFTAASAIGASSGGGGCSIGGVAQKLGGGNHLLNYCGPATATIQIRGKTYMFKHGSCFTGGTPKGSVAIFLGVGYYDSDARLLSGSRFLGLELAGKDVVVEGVGSNDKTFEADPNGLVSGDSSAASLKGTLVQRKAKGIPGFTGSWSCGDTTYPFGDFLEIAKAENG